MSGPGEYVPDATEGVARVEDLPKPKVVRRSRDRSKLRCPECGHKAYRNRRQSRTLRDVGDPVSERPREIVLTVSQHHCTRCDRYFLADTSDLAPPGSHYTNRVVAKAVRLVAEDGLPYRPASWHMWRDHRVFVPFATIQNWVEASADGLAPPPVRPALTRQGGKSRGVRAG
jgi:hypothetical protein